MSQNKSNLIEQIVYKNKILAIIIRYSFSKDGIEFFTPNFFSQQVGYMKRPKGYEIKPHIHNQVQRTINNTQEVLIIKKGKVRVDFYDIEKVYISSKILSKGDLLILVSGGHGFFMEEESEIFEVKQGPYFEDSDKEKFYAINNDMVVLK